MSIPQGWDYFSRMPFNVLAFLAEVAMKTGDTVTVLDVHENKLRRTVVAVEDGFVFVSRPEEVKNAHSENREPMCIGFPLSDVVSQPRHNRS